jgi:2-polyprenyl-3-methyl-5-hydroxy-6-metoxy-1,4-benzoquinol methylase
MLAKDLPFGLDFYLGLAREAKGPVLDIACGTGRILLPCLQAGVDIEGLDLYEPMLAPLRAKAAALGLARRPSATRSAPCQKPRGTHCGPSSPKSRHDA